MRTIILLFILSCQAIFGQNARPFIQIGLEQGLPQLQVMSLYQDTKGFIWIGTKGGLSRFDGKNLINYGKKDGLINLEISAIQEDKNGVIWIVTRTEIAKKAGKKFVTFPKPEYLTQLDINFDFITRENEILVNGSDAEGHLTLLTLKNNKYVKYAENRRLIYYSIAFDFYLYQEGDGYFAQKGKNGKKMYLKEKYLVDYVNAFIENKSLKLCAVSNSQPRLYRQLNNPIQFQPDEMTFAGTQHNVLQHPQMIETLAYAFANKQWLVTRYLIDNCGNVWLGTEGDGVIVYPKPIFTSIYTAENGKDQVWQIAEYNDEYYFGKYFNTSHSLAIWNEIRNEIREVPINFPFYFGHNTDFNGNLILGGGSKSLKVSKNEIKKFGPNSLHHVFYIFKDTINLKLLYGTTVGLLIEDKKGNFENHDVNGKNKLLSNNVLCMAQDRTGIYWLGNSSGILQFDGKTFIKPTDSIAQAGARAIATDHRNSVWFGGTSLYIYRNQKFRAVQHPILDDKLIMGLYQADKSRLLIGMSKGLALLDLDYFYTKDSVRIKFYDKYNGFETSECQQNSFFKDSKNRMWVATMKSVYRFNSEDLVFDTVPLPLHITSVKFQNNEMDWQIIPDTISQFSPDYRNLKFEFIGIDFTQPDKTKYKFILEGNDNEWTKPNNQSFAHYTNLSPGNYTFRVMAANADGRWGKETTFKFRINHYFYETLWFIVPVLLLLILSIAAVTNAFYKRKKQKLIAQLSLKERLSRLEIESINNRLNPHFLNNSLQSAQIIAYEDDKEKITEFITQLSGMLNSVLRKEKHQHARSLSDEISFVKNYFYLQRIRFGEKLNLEVDINQNIDQNILIPRMCIQILVENSILHGIMPKEKLGGTVWITITKDKNNLKIIVRDNGIGLEEAKKSKHKSTGVGLAGLRDLHDFLNRENSSKIEFIIQDYYMEGKVCGVEAVQQIPLNLKY